MCIIKLLARLIAKKADISTALLANKTIRELQREVIMGKFIELTGQRFGRLVVIGRSREIRTQGIYWNCICDCGTKKVITGSSLRGTRAARQAPKTVKCFAKKTIDGNQGNDKHIHETQKPERKAKIDRQIPQKETTGRPEDS